MRVLFKLLLKVSLRLSKDYFFLGIFNGAIKKHNGKFGEPANSVAFFSPDDVDDFPRTMIDKVTSKPEHGWYNLARK